MDSFWIYVIVFVVWLVISGLRASKKANKNNQGRKVDNAPKKSKDDISTQREIFKQLGLEDVYAEIQGEKKPQQQPVSNQPPQTVSRPKTIQKEPEPHFLDRELEIADQSHYSERKLVEEFKRVHKEGKQLEHHVHSSNEAETATAYDQEETKPYDAVELHMYDEIKKGSLTDDRSQEQLAYESIKTNEKRDQIKKIIRSKTSLRNSILMKEILTRKEF